MASQGTVAPKERVNIVYKPATGDAEQEVELPLKILMLGDYTCRPDTTVLENRKAIHVDKDNFDAVMDKQNLSVDLQVADKLGDSAGAEHSVKLRFSRLRDFGPDAIAQNVPVLRQLLELRSALTTLRSPLANEKLFRKKIQDLLEDGSGRDRLLRELGLSTVREDAPGAKSDK